jgi:hypothetical protein
LKKEALDRQIVDSSLWKRLGPVVRQTNIWMNYYRHALRRHKK